MSDIEPILTFKAGRCEGDIAGSGETLKCDPQKGYIYLFVDVENDFSHFCWRPRDHAVNDPENIDLIMFPGDARFLPYTGRDVASDTSPTNGRIFALKFSSSSQRYLFWLQSPPHNTDAPNKFSSRDLKIGELVDVFLQGEIPDEESIRDASVLPGEEDDDGAESSLFRAESSGAGGAGADATGGDIREEGEEAREGGADGGRASSGAAKTETSRLIQNFVQSLQQGGSASGQQALDHFTTLPDLLSSSTTIPLLQIFPESTVDSLLSSLPAPVLLLAHSPDDDTLTSDDEISWNATLDSDEKVGLIMSLSLEQKEQILEKVLRSPQLSQSLGSLTVALRDGGLPTIASALGIEVKNNGYARGSAMPLGGGEAVRAFVEGVKDKAEKESQEGVGDQMDVE